ncbi:MAG: O-methyltransferase [Candidatus Bathyarchaeia archaeon]
MQYEDIMNYVSSLVGPGDELQIWVQGRSNELSEYGVVPIDPTRGRFLELIARSRSPRRILEIGSGAGYSALWLMKGIGRKGTLESIEADPHVASELQEVIKKAGLKRRIKIHQGAALMILRKLKGPYDLVFIDADKDEYPQYLQHAIKLTVPGSIILADNLFWSGATFLPGVRKEGAEGIIEYTKRIFNDSRLSSLIIPLGDGLGISYRLK